MPQQPPSIVLARGPFANRIAVIACAAVPSVAPRGVSDNAAATIMHPYRFPNHINPIRFQVIRLVASKLARPVNKSKLSIRIVISPIGKNRAPPIPPTCKLIIQPNEIIIPASIEYILSTPRLFCTNIIT